MMRHAIWAFLVWSCAWGMLAAGQLDPAYYPNHLVPEVILRETARREARYLDTLDRRLDNRLETLRQRAWSFFERWLNADPAWSPRR